MASAIPTILLAMFEAACVMSPPIATKAVPATAAAIESTPSTTVALPKPEARFATTPMAGCTAPRRLGPKPVSAGPSSATVESAPGTTPLMTVRPLATALEALENAPSILPAVSIDLPMTRSAGPVPASIPIDFAMV